MISKGLAQISVRELSAALKLKKAGIYYYFADKDEAIIECAEEAARRLEFNLIAPALKDIKNPERMMARLMDRADEMAPTMKFFAQVCADPRYQEKMHPVLNRLAQRYEHYAAEFAKSLGCEVDKVTPYLYICVTAMVDYMIFNESILVQPQLSLVKKKLAALL